MSSPILPRIVIAFAVLYVVWGSTYLAIRVMVESLPPLLSAGLRFLLASILMLAYALYRKSSFPRLWEDWRRILLTGVLMLVLANGLVTWSEQWIESNQAALIVATSAVWTAWLGTLGHKGERLKPVVVMALGAGLAGVAVLVGEGLHLGHAPWWAYLAMLGAPLLWSVGSVLAKRDPPTCTPMMTAALQCLATGIIMTTAGLSIGEASKWTWDARSLAALLYLAVFGTCLAYGVFLWLVHQVTPAQLSTYAYVNPVVAVFLGNWLLEETLGPLQVAGTVIILASVIVVTYASSRSARDKPPS